MDSLGHVFEAVSSYFALLSEPMRLRILHALCKQERTVSDIVAEIGASQTNVSRHLNTMYRAGALNRRKQGTFTYYSVRDSVLTEICRTVCTHVAARGDVRDEISGIREFADGLAAFAVAQPPVVRSGRGSRSNGRGRAARSAAGQRDD